VITSPTNKLTMRASSDKILGIGISITSKKFHDLSEKFSEQDDAIAPAQLMARSFDPKPPISLLSGNALPTIISHLKSFLE
jgi:hypothetical protein